jgi:hypothetical protein
VTGAFVGKFERLSTAITCGPAPIAKKISVALGDNEIIRFGSLAILVVYPPNLILSGYLVSTACAGLPKTVAKTKIEIAIACKRKRVRNIEKTPSDM